MHLLSDNLCSTQSLRRGLSNLLLSTCLILRLLLLLICECGQSTRSFANLHVSQRLRELADEVLDEGRVQWLGLVPLDDVLDYLVREIDEVLLRPWLRRDERVELLRGGS